MAKKVKGWNDKDPRFKSLGVSRERTVARKKKASTVKSPKKSNKRGITITIKN